MFFERVKCTEVKVYETEMKRDRRLPRPPAPAPARLPLIFFATISLQNNAAPILSSPMLETIIHSCYPKIQPMKYLKAS
jgi:hypothetical protein